MKQAKLSFLKKDSSTDEQTRIINFKFDRNQYLLVKAYAGTGKTTTCLGVIKANSDRRILYTVFNKSMQTSVLQTLHELDHPSLTVRTTHSMALAYCRSLAPTASFSESQLGKEHIDLYKMWNGYLPESELCDASSDLWREMLSGETPYPSHQAYYHVFVRKCLDSAAWIDAACDLLIVDEAQDTDVGLLEVIRQVTVPVMLVGDQHQDIYKFRNTANALDELRGPRSVEMSLTESFRFGPAVAELVNSKFGLALIGRGSTSVIRKGLIDAFAYGPCTLLCRTNLQVFHEAYRQTCSIHVLGNVFPQLAKLYQLPVGTLERKLARYKDEGNQQMASLVEMVLEIDVSLVEAVKAKQTPASKAKLIIGTVHSAKGLEWDRVVINPGINEPSLKYVAATRARSKLFIPSDF